MVDEVDITPCFSDKALIKAYLEYKRGKTDRFKPWKIKIPMGADGVTWQEFERNLPKRCQSISDAVKKGSYQFYPFREVIVEKPKGKQRPLSLACIRDALVQKQLYDALYWSAEKFFSDPIIDSVSFGYRKYKSAPQAIKLIYKSFIHDGYTHALDADIKKFFDNLSHNRLLALIDDWIGLDSLPGRLLKRYIKTPSIPFDPTVYLTKTGKRKKNWKKHFKTTRPNLKKDERVRTLGIPQGGVLSGLLANIYLNEFDKWIMYEVSREYNIRYFRYADDFVILSKSKEDNVRIYEKVSDFISNRLGLELHPLLEFDPLKQPKTRVIDFHKDGLNFLGFRLNSKSLKVRERTIRAFKKRFLLALKGETKLKYETGIVSERVEKAIKYLINPKIRGAESEICPICRLSYENKHSWMAFFASTVTNGEQLQKLDKWMRYRIYRYFWMNYRVRIKRPNLSNAEGFKILSLIKEYRKLRKSNYKVCKCQPPSPEEDTIAL